MKKLVLLVSALTIALLLILVPMRARAARQTTVYLGANGSGSCTEKGYVSPAQLTFDYNDQVTMTFINEQATKLTVRNVPGGDFILNGNSMARRNFRAAHGFTYSIWLASKNCEKAEATVAIKGGWWVKTWPWILALIGTAAVLWAVSRVEHPRNYGKSTHASGNSDDE